MCVLSIKVPIRKKSGNLSYTLVYDPVYTYICVCVHISMCVYICRYMYMNVSLDYYICIKNMYEYCPLRNKLFHCAIKNTRRI